MNLLIALHLGLRVNPPAPSTCTDRCVTCADFKPTNGATTRCLRDPLNIDPVRHRHRAIWCGLGRK